MAKWCSNMRMTVLTFLGTEQELQTTVLLLQGSSCTKEAKAETTFQGLCVYGEQLLQCSQGPVLSYS